jgi:hypothetical protein
MNNTFKLISQYFFNSIETKLGSIRLKLALLILPRDLSEFFNIVLSKIDNNLNKLDNEKRKKIISLRIDFDFIK